MLYAKRGIGKTFLGLGIAHAVSSGTKFLRWEAPTPRRVLYVDGELPGRLLQERYRIVSGGAPSSNLRFISPDFQDGIIPDLASREGQALVEAHLEGVGLVILDNLSCLVRGVKENEGEGWLPIQGWALELRRKGVSEFFLHHAGKQGTQRGTSRREDVLDTVITLRNPSDYRAEEGLRVELHFEKCRSLTGDDVRSFEVRLETRTGNTEWTMRDVEDAKKARALELLDEGISYRDIAEEVKVGKSTVQRWAKARGVPCPTSKVVGQRDSEE
jgi:putative DNA primase/helicase